MIEELELKHVIDHAKHGGKLRCLDDDNVYFDDEIKIIDFVTGYIETKEGIMIELSDFGDFVFMVKRPFSDLTKEIGVNGEKFFMEDKINKELLYTSGKLNCGNGVVSLQFPQGISNILIAIHNEVVDECPLGIYDLLMKYHFDTLGLIESKLAIDINTLNK